MTSNERVCAFLKETKTYYLATQENDQPRVRPFGTIHIFEDKLYIQTGAKKDVYNQIMKNPKFEICAFNGENWLRLEGKLEQDDRIEAKKSMLDAYPELRRMYDENNPDTIVFFIKEAVATFASFGKESETIKL